MRPISVPEPVPHHHARAVAGGHDGAGEQHAGTVADAGGGRDLHHLLGRGDRLARQRRLVDLEVRPFEEPEIGRHPVAAAHADDVTRHERGGVHQPPRAVTQRLGIERLHTLQAGERGRGATLLHEADQSGGGDDRPDDGEVHPVARDRLEHGRGHEDVHKHVVELAEQAAPPWLGPRGGQLVAALSREASGGLGAGKAVRAGIDGAHHVQRRGRPGRVTR